LVDRRAVERVAPGRFDQPIALLQDRLASLDSLLEFVVRTESKQRKPGQAHALSLAAGGVDDDMAIAVDLADPETAGILDTDSGGIAEQFGLLALGQLAQISRQRIVGDGRKDSEHNS